MVGHILGLGTALPSLRISQSHFARLAAAMCTLDDKRSRVFNRLYNRSKIDTRHSVVLEPNGDDAHPTQSFFEAVQDEQDRGPTIRDRMSQYETHALPLALRAARSAMTSAGIDATQIGHSVTVSCTGFHAPGVDVQLREGLELSPDIGRTHVGFMGCHGAFNGLRVAAAMAAQLPAQSPCVLVTAVELCSLHFAYGFDPQKIVANALFADGAASVVLGPRTLHTGEASSAARMTEHWRLAANGTTIIPGTQDAMTWHIRDHGFEMTLSPRVPQLIQQYLRPWLTKWLGGHGLQLSDIASWAVHPGGPRILESVEEALDLPCDALVECHDVLAQCGNMSSPTILFICERLIRKGAPAPCVAIGFGPGLTIEAMLFT